MTPIFRRLGCALACIAAWTANSQPVAPVAPVPASAPTASALRSFAVEITTGPAWDASKPPQSQAFFAEHSAHLRDLRRAGHITAGVRYGSKGLLVFSAANIEAVRDLLKPDPSLVHGTFVADVQPLLVFYPGMLGSAPPARPASAP